MKKTWSYFVNPFLVLGKRNFKKAVKISTYHDSALQTSSGDPFFAAMYAAYHPFHLALVNAYNVWKNSGGTQKGATLTVEQLLKLLSPVRINSWDAQVQIQLPKGTSDYVSVFPNGHQPFQEGEIDERINAVQQLSLALTPFAPLAGLKIDVNTFYDQLTTARDLQLGKKGDTNHFSDMLRNKITDAMVAMYSDLGLVMDKFKINPVEGEPLFDLETIRNHDQVVFTGALAGSETENILEHTFAADDEIRLQSTGDTSLGFYMAANTTDGPTGYTVINVASHDKLLVKASDFGSLDNHFLHVINTGTIPGEFKVQLL